MSLLIPELGNFLLIMAFINAIFLGVLSFVGAHYEHQGLMRFTKRSAISIFLLILASFICLTVSFINNDFSVAYVANHSNSQLPIYYRISAVWGAIHSRSPPLNVALWPATISNSTVPKAKTSVAGPTSEPRNCSGDM